MADLSIEIGNYFMSVESHYQVQSAELSLSKEVSLMNLQCVYKTLLLCCVAGV